MGGNIQDMLLRSRKVISAILLVIILFSDIGSGLIQNKIPVAEAAQVTIDADAFTTGTSHLQSGSQTVFIDDQTGYKFFRDAAGYCVYRKSTNGGMSWGATTTVDSQGGGNDCIQVQVWYDRWTPGDTGNYIHIATLDTSADDIFYNRLDTSSDTLLLGSSPVDVSTNSGNSAATVVVGQNTMSITKGTDGTVYTGIADTSDSYVVECSASCNLAASWTETGTNPMDNANDYNILVPLANGDIMIINRDISLEDIRTKIWNNSAWSGSWTTIDANATDHATYDVGMAVAVSSSTPGHVYFAYTADNAAIGVATDVRVAFYNGSTWATSTDVISNSATRGVTGVAIGLDAVNDDVYVAYSAQTTPNTAATGNIYWKTATSSMMNWSTEVGPVNSSAGDLFGVDLNPASDQRLHVSWFNANAGVADIYGDTIADIFPGVHASSSDTQTASVNASTNNFYIGKFLFYNTYKPLDVTGLTITESGTIDSSAHIANVKLYYETDTSAPYNCISESYAGTESQFGSTDSNGFSGADGVSSFTGTTVNVSTSTSLCVYVVLDVLDSASSTATIDISINNPVTDVTVTGSTAGPATAQNITGITQVLNDTATLTHYHWRNDDGTETTATSRTSGSEDTSLTALQQNSPIRLRMGISNEGSSSTPALSYRLEYAQASGACTEATGWIDVGASNGDFDMYDSTNITDGNNTTNIAVSSGGVTDENTTFLTSNGGLKDTSSETGAMVLSTTEHTDIEYAIVASTTATEGNTYCFRVTNQGVPLPRYDTFPRANIAADVLVTIATTSQTANTNIPATNFHVGSAFVVTDNTGSHTVTDITIAETGTVDARNDLDNIKLYYDLDTSAPYDCGSESYGGGEAQFGATDTDGFSSANGTSTFSGSVGISTTATMCLYTILDTTATAQNGKTIDIIMENPSVNLVVSGGGSVSPTVIRNMNGLTTLVGAVLTQTHFHWRNDNGNETAATSMTGGIADTSIANVGQTTPVRLRVQISNEGTITSLDHAFRLEYGTKITSCTDVSNWTHVSDTGGAWDMFNSSNLTEGSDTTNITEGSGGMNDENTTFLTPNSAIKDTTSIIATTSLTSTQFLEAEFSIQQTADAGFDTPYCFRISGTNVPLDTYTVYPEAHTSPERDFEIQRGTATITGTSITLTAGVDYVAPAASTSAFIRITNSHHTGAGDNFNGGTQNADDVTAYIQNPSDILTSVTIARPSTALSDTRVSWEIIEFIGEPGSDNEMIVRAQGPLTYTTTSLTATGTAISGITDDNDVVVFITGQGHPDTATGNYNSMQSTSAWLASSDQPVFTRGDTGSDATVVSYAVVEFTGLNWFTQRSEHTYTSAGTTETEAITAVNSLSRTFLHTQKRITTGLPGTDEFGHEVWLSSIGQVSYFLETGATTPSEQTSVAWIIENTQTSAGAMDVTRSNGNSNGGAEPLTVSIGIGKTLSDITNASIFVNSRSAGTGNLYPRPIAGAIIASTTHYELWRSDTGAMLTYRTEIVEWPTAGLALRQNYYRFYTDNNALKPTDAWPIGGIDLGENTSLTVTDEPLGEAERIRIRMSLRALNATFPAGTKALTLQYGVMNTTCSAISSANWITLGDSASSTVWRGYNATGTTDGTLLSGNPPTGGDLLLSVSDVAGTYEETNDTTANTYAVPEGSDIEYDWIIEQNGATANTDYCFRMIESNGTVLSGYDNYPQIRTANFSPRTQNWRWYDDEINETPTVTLAAENIAPVDIANAQAVKLRVTVKEIKNVAQDDTRFKLQFSEYSDFSQVFDVIATSTCTATSSWCYAEGGGVDNAVISTGTLSDAESCVGGVGDGCGTHNESPLPLTGFRHKVQKATEYEFTIQSAGPRVNRVYYFRLFDILQNIPVVTNVSESYPSLVTKGASLVFQMEGLASSTVIEGVTLDIDSTPTTIAYGSIPADAMVEAGHRLTIDTNGTQGHQILMMMNGDLLSSGGSKINPITGTNASPTAWSTGCVAEATSCFGYHTGDDTLQGGSTRFSAIDTYARMSTTTPEEISYNSQPVVGEVADIVFRLFRRQLQDAGRYESSIMYISVPMF